ncbi:hypothetical protein E2C01_051352 [Portunus trituberculatus]|uniref:Uncharacterized protein n=1 Tax=Portunus trituberculatus TaxID=210409 RepID=A0A5B7GIV6_PORTR|nr:hypothetical protein [Portunus trituberculatus]
MLFLNPSRPSPPVPPPPRLQCLPLQRPRHACLFIINYHNTTLNYEALTTIAPPHMPRPRHTGTHRRCHAM